MAPLRGLSLSAGSPTHPGWRTLAGGDGPQGLDIGDGPQRLGGGDGPQGLDDGDRLVVVEGFIDGTKLELF